MSNSIKSSITIVILVLLSYVSGFAADSAKLRSESAELSKEELLTQFKEAHLNCPGSQISGSFQNQFESVLLRDVKIVNDHSTGLMWQGVQTNTRYSWRELEAYLEKVNSEELAGYSDWRIPTALELGSLLSRKAIRNYYISDAFEIEGYLSTWTSDIFKGQVGGAWFINFMDGQIMDGNRLAGLGHIRLVREM